MLSLNFSEKERQQSGISDTCGCLWMYLADLRAPEGSSHVHYNLFYDPSKHEKPLLPPAAALAPTLWPQFHLRWACPSEAQAGEVEAQCRSLSKKLSELQKVFTFNCACCLLYPILLPPFHIIIHGVLLTLSSYQVAALNCLLLFNNFSTFITYILVFPCF